MEESASVTAFGEWQDEYLGAYLKASEAIGGVVQEQVRRRVSACHLALPSSSSGAHHTPCPFVTGQGGRAPVQGAEELPRPRIAMHQAARRQASRAPRAYGYPPDCCRRHQGRQSPKPSVQSPFDSCRRNPGRGLGRCRASLVQCCSRSELNSGGDGLTGAQAGAACVRDEGFGCLLRQPCHQGV